MKEKRQGARKRETERQREREREREREICDLGVNGCACSEEAGPERARGEWTHMLSSTLFLQALKQVHVEGDRCF